MDRETVIQQFEPSTPSSSLHWWQKLGWWASKIYEFIEHKESEKNCIPFQYKDIFRCRDSQKIQQSWGNLTYISLHKEFLLTYFLKYSFKDTKYHTYFRAITIHRNCKLHLFTPSCLLYSRSVTCLISIYFLQSKYQLNTISVRTRPSYSTAYLHPLDRLKGLCKVSK